MTIEEARMLAAQAWCKLPHKVMDTCLCEEFAKILMEQVNKVDLIFKTREVFKKHGFIK
jgi:hypothetical protein